MTLGEERVPSSAGVMLHAPKGESLPAPTPEQTVAVALKYGMVYKNP